ncbi:MAG: hypothetical protein Kow00124_03320 [Anaerolineae bacterium]
MEDKTRPTAITLDKEKHELRVQWEDGITSHYPLNALREACPCAACRGGHEMMGPEHDPDLETMDVKGEYQVRDVQLVGNYALQFWWSDGHNSGIYSFSYLRRISPEVKRAGGDPKENPGG